MWARMVGGDWEGEEEVKEVKEGNLHPKAKAPPPQQPTTKTGGKKIPRMHFESDDSSNGALPPSKKKDPPPPGHKGLPRPQDNPPPPPKGGEVDLSNDPIVGTKVHVPYSRGMEVGTVRGVHQRKAGCLGGKPKQPPTLQACPQPPFPLPRGRPGTP